MSTYISSSPSEISIWRILTYVSIGVHASGFILRCPVPLCRRLWRILFFKSGSLLWGDSMHQNSAPFHVKGDLQWVSPPPPQYHQRPKSPVDEGLKLFGVISVFQPRLRPGLLPRLQPMLLRSKTSRSLPRKNRRSSQSHQPVKVRCPPPPSQ